MSCLYNPSLQYIFYSGRKEAKPSVEIEILGSVLLYAV